MIIDNPIVSGSLNVQNDVTASNLAIASTASAAYFTGSFIGDGTQLSGVTSYTDADTLSFIQGYSGSYSGSFIGDGSQLSGVTSYTDADTLAYINSRDVISGSAQIAAFGYLTSSSLGLNTKVGFIPTSSFVSYDPGGSATQASASVTFATPFSSSNYQVFINFPNDINDDLQSSIPPPFGVVNKTTTGFGVVTSLNTAQLSFQPDNYVSYLAIADGETAVTSSFTLLSATASYVEYENVANKPTLISSSAQFTDLTAPFTGSFTGSFIGDGSQLSGVTSYTDADTLAYINSRAVLSGSIAELTAVTASFLNTGSVTIPHSFNSKNVSVSVYDSNDILIIPQEIALISNNAVKLTFGGSTSGFAVVSKGGHIVSGSVPVPQLSTVTSAFTSATSHTVTHNFNTKEVIVSVYENDSLIIPDTVTTDDVNNVTVTFPEAISGRVVVVKAGHIVSGSIPFDNLLDSPLTQSTLAISASKHIVPAQDLTYDLGSSTLRFRDLYLSSASIYLGNTVISEDNVVTTASLATALPPGVMSGSNQMAGETIDGDLTITGTMTAKEFHTEFVSASIIYQSGSTKFGDTVDDTHEFTGSVDISGSLYIKGGEQPGLITNVTSYFSLVSTGDTSNTTGARIWLGNGQNDAGYYQNANGHYFRGLSSNLQMYIDGTGNVGIGTNNPTTALHVQGEISIGGGESADDARMYFKASDNSNRFTIETDLDGTTDNDILGFRTSAADNVLVLKGDGNVGIGTNNPLTKLHIDGTASPTIRLESTSGPYSLISSNTVGSVEIAADAGNGGTGTNINFKVDDYNVMRIASSGDQGKVGIGTTSPESNAKLDVRGNLLVGGGSTYAGTGVTSVTINNDLYPLLSLGSTSSNRMELIAYSSYNLFSSTNNFVFDSGRVGIGITSPGAKLTIRSHVNAPAATSGTTQTGGALRLEGGNNAVIDFGLNSVNTWIQATDKSALNTGYILSLNPNGGAVGVGTTSPIRSLHIHGGSISADTPTLRISSTDSSGTNKFGIEFYSTNGADVRGKLLADNNGRVYLDDNGGGGVVLQANGGSGKVGIGTVTPAAKLEVFSRHSTTEPTIDFGSYSVSNNQPYGMIAMSDAYHGLVMRGYPNDASNYGVTYGDYMSFFEYGGIFRFYKKQPGILSTIAEITDSNTYFDSNVGIGTTSPTAKLQVYGDMTVGATSPETKVTVDGGVKASAFWIHDRVGWIATISPEGWDTVVSTGTISNGAGSASLDILSVYTDGHWGGSVFGEIWAYTSYYGAGVRKYKFYAGRAGYVSVVEIDSSGTEAPMTIDVHSTSIIGSGTHNGQSVAKSVIRLNTNAAYVSARALIKLGHSDNSRKIFDNRSTDANVQADRVSNGGAYHFRSVDLSDLPYISTV